MEVDPRSYYDSGFTEADSSDLTCLSSNIDNLASSSYNLMKQHQQQTRATAAATRSNFEFPSKRSSSSKNSIVLPNPTNQDLGSESELFFRNGGDESDDESSDEAFDAAAATGVNGRPRSRHRKRAPPMTASQRTKTSTLQKRKSAASTAAKSRQLIKAATTAGGEEAALRLEAAAAAAAAVASQAAVSD